MPYHVTGTIEGVAPILFNQPYTEPASRKTEEQRRTEALARRIYRDERGVFIPKWTFKKMLCVDGATRAGLKIARASMTRYLLAGLFLDDDPIFTGQEIAHETWGRVPPRTGAMVKVWRPGLDTGWQLTFGFQVIDDLVRPSEVRAALDIAGLGVGLGGWRPEYGRFVVKDWHAT